MRGAVAAGHPLTAEAGARVLAEGGNAVDACIAASFASWVVESPLSGPGGGGFMLVHRAGDRSARLLDFFVAVPGLGRRRRPAGTADEIDVDFDGSTRQVFRIGPATVAVPGSAAGLERAHQSYGSLPWSVLVEPALELARRGFEFTPAQAYLHAILDVILRHTPEGRRVYGRRGKPFAAGDRVRLPDLAGTLELIAVEGAAAVYRGELADAIRRASGGRLTRADLADYRVIARQPVAVPFRGHELLSNPPPSSGGVLIAYALALLGRRASTPRRLVEVGREQARVRAEPAFERELYRGGLARRLLASAGRKAAPIAEAAAPGGTTHISVVDSDGNAASLSASIGSGSGVVVPGTGIHLNNMLGEADLNPGSAPAGRRLTSMMAPSIVLRGGRPRLVVGSAGSARLRGAILQVVLNVVEHGLLVGEAIERPRLHVDGASVHCESGFDTTGLAGYDLIHWRERNLFFGGVSGVELRDDGTLAAAGDPRRGGHGVVVA
jgi:gamma-glutamyltranspeptidase/glutathione hydrolase